MMTSYQKCYKLLLSYHLKNRCLNCKYSSWSSESIRNGFIEYFSQNHDHKFVKSSPVIPYCDPTVAFVNAGMNQFKGIFLGQFSPNHPRVVNSQKCIRVGGKHNDLDIIGTDGYHHTFFEMLGNWSFGDYYKREACEMAWKLLVDHFKIDPKRLVVTYFEGDQKLGLEADHECRDIWKQIGISDDSMVACGTADNFWEMGSSGPCGPCTEIHYRKDDGNLMEIWNLVFIQFNRLPDGNIVPLPKCHVDTGMGLERITALLQNKSSNYDTDLFLPIIRRIELNSSSIPRYTGKFGENANLDTAYRILADHSRMISICLADGVFPCRNLRMRSVLRKAIMISNDVFKNPSGLLIQLYDEVEKMLGKSYPELKAKRKQAEEIILQEEQSVMSLGKVINKQRKELMKSYPEISELPNDIIPGFYDGYRYFKETMKDMDSSTIPGNVAFKMYDTFGLDKDLIMKIAEINKYSVDMEVFNHHLLEQKMKHKAAFTESINVSENIKLNMKIEKLTHEGITKTDDAFKYSYTGDKNGRYTFQSLKAKLLQVLSKDGDKINKVAYNETIHLLLDKTNFYCEEGGQSHDVGIIRFNNGNTFSVECVSKVCGIVLHTGKFIDNKSEISFNISDMPECTLILDKENRFKLMQHHTATHLLNAALKRVLPKTVTCQLSSKVAASHLNLDLAIYGEKLSSKVISDAQELVRMVCANNTAVRTSTIDSQVLMSLEGVTTVPGEVYPEVGLRLVEVDLIDAKDCISRELCCGTHVKSTGHIGDFCIVSVRGAGSQTPSFKAIAGEAASRLHEIYKEVGKLRDDFTCNEITDQTEEIGEKIRNIKKELQELCKGDGTPFGTQGYCLDTLAVIEKKIKEKDAKKLIAMMKTEMDTVSAEADLNQKPFLVHFLICSYLLEASDLTLSTAAQHSDGKPALVLGCAAGVVKATCFVPMEVVTENFTAEKWMTSILPAFSTTLMQPTRGQNIKTLAHMKGKRVSLINCEALVADAIKRANEYANDHFQKNKELKGAAQ